MKTEQILDLDYRNDKSKEIIQKALKLIKPLSKYEDDVPQEAIEKLIGSICRKYSIMIQYICPTYMEGEINIYSCSLKRTDNHEWVGNTYGHLMYELLAKTAIKLYMLVKKDEIPVNDWDEIRRKKQEQIKKIKNGEK